MHSSIFEIRTENLPECEWAGESAVPSWFLQEIADYVEVSENREVNIDGLLCMFGTQCTMCVEFARLHFGAPIEKQRGEREKCVLRKNC